MTKEKSTVPRLRFPGFTDAWKQRKLGEVAEINPKSVLPDEFEYVDLESVVGTEMISHRTEYKNSAPSRAQRVASKGDIFYQTVRPYQKNNYLFDIDSDDFVFSTGYAQLRPSCNGYFMFTVIQTEKFVNNVLDNCTGTSYPAINANKLAEISIFLPPTVTPLTVRALPEQEAIGSFFSDLDQLITLHQRKLDDIKELKKALLQKMFPKGNGNDFPELRFPEFTDAWKQRKLGEVSKRVTRRNKELISSLPLTISAQHGLVDQEEFFNKQVASKDVSSYYLIKKGEFAYNKSYSNGYPWGAIKRLDRYEMGVLSTLYIIFKPTSLICSDYLVSYYDTVNWYKEVSMIAAEGARNHGLLNIAPNDFFETRLFIPTLPEQEAIGSFFSDLDQLITLHQRQLDHLKLLKKALLQQMFI
ncbi:TPA: restriction endonuclease subunit S [Streptococcus suis]|nr:restriction endonuclease subunit S [Streptococcus suis]